MLIIKKTKKKIKGTIKVASSKSISQRYLVVSFFNALNNNKTTIYNYSSSTDFLNLLNNFKKLGLKYTIAKTKITVTSFKKTRFKVLDTKDSAFNLRFLAVVLKVLNKDFIIKHSIFKRIKDDINLKELINNKNSIKLNASNLIKKTISIDTSISSQTLSAYMFLLAHLYTKAKIKVKNLKSYEFIKLSIYVLKQLNIRVVKNNNIFTIFSKQYKDAKLKVLDDMSLVCFYAMLSLKYNSIKIKNINNIQGEYLFIKLLKKIGANYIIKNKVIIFKKTIKLKAFKIDISHNPDLICPLIVLACVCTGKSVITGVKRLVYKEEDRVNVMLKYLKKLKIKANFTNDSINVFGNGFTYDFASDKVFKISSKDHRIVMSLVSLLVNSRILFIKNSQCVNKSNQDFFMNLKKLGFNL